MNCPRALSVRRICDNPLLSAIWLVCLVTSIASAGPRILGPQDPAGKEVRETAAEFYHDIAGGNAAAAHALFAGPQDHAALLDAELDAVAASREMMRSILSHFGPDNANLLTTSAVVTFLRFGDQELTAMVVLNGDEAATAVGSEPDSGLLLRRIEGKWKVIHTTRESHRTATARKYYTLLAAAYHDVRRKVDRGELKTADAALTAMQKRLDAFNAQRSTDPEDDGRALVSATQPALTAERLRLLMGRQMFSPQVTEVIDSLPCMPRLSEYRTVLFISVPELGIDLSFKLPEGRLRAVQLYGGGDPRFSRYRGTLPAGLAFGQPRIDVERRLGRAASYSGWITSGVVAEYPNLKLLAQYAPGPVRNPRAPLTTVTLIESPTFVGATTRRFGEPPPQLTIRAVLDEHDPAPADRLPDPQDPAGIAILRVARDAIIDQDSIAAAGPFPDPNDIDGWKIQMELTPDGGRRLLQATKNLVGRRVAIVLGSRVLIAPIVRDPIGEHVSIDFGENGRKPFPDKLLREIRVAMMSLPAADSAATPK